AAPGTAADPDSFRRMFGGSGPGWLASDGTVSVRLPDGRSLWLMDDSFVGTASPDGRRAGPGSRFVRNTLLVQDGDRLLTLSGGPQNGRDALAPPNDPTRWYWLDDAAVQGSNLVVVAERMEVDPTKPADGWNFRHVSTDLVTLSLPTLSVAGVQ